MSNFKAMTLTGDESNSRASREGRGYQLLASWRKLCIQELGFLQKLSKKLDGQFVVLAVSTDDSNTIAGVRKIDKEVKNADTPDQQGSLMSEYNPRGELPFSVYVDKMGRIASTHQ